MTPAPDGSSGVGPWALQGQDAVFAASEADRWFERNREWVTAPDHLERDPVSRALDLAGIVPRRLLEVGAANGFRLHDLRLRCGCEATGVEPSRHALEDGRNRYPEIRLLEGVASALPLPSAAFDVVIVNAVLHWVDRASLLRAVAEIDRVLEVGGYLALGDFHPARATKTPYHHVDDGSVFTYKQAYHEIFLSSKLYELVTFLSYEFGSGRVLSDVPPDRRGAVSILRKSYALYEPAPAPSSAGP